MSVTSELKVGDTAYILAARGNSVFTAKVKRITATGQVVVTRKGATDDYDTRFDPRGKEIGGSSTWYHAQLISKADYDSRIGEQLKRQRAANAKAAAHAFAQGQWGTDPDVPALLAKLDELRALVQLIEPQS